MDEAEAGADPRLRGYGGSGPQPTTGCSLLSLAGQRVPVWAGLGWQLGEVCWVVVQCGTSSLYHQPCTARPAQAEAR